MAAAVREAVALYDDLSAREDVVVSKYSLASVYHKIATVFLGKEDGASALPLLDKCLEIYPDYVAAVVDKAAALFYLKDPVKVRAPVYTIYSISSHSLCYLSSIRCTGGDGCAGGRESRAGPP